MARTLMPRPSAAPPAALPLDVRLMNHIASSVFTLAIAALLAAGVLWLTRAPLFSIRQIQLEGDLARNNISTLRANVMPQLQGNFFSLSLQRARAAFESLPWVRRAVVRRVWPNRLVVQLQEQHAAALWLGDDGNDRLVNRFGEVFDANIGDVEEDGLPTLAGASDEAGAMLLMLQRLQPVLALLDQHIDTLSLSGRGSWRVELDSGAVIELGRGSDDEVLARTARFARTFTQLASRYREPLEYADLRHANGYAVRLRGVTTKTIN